jgi:hypothetical protein
MLIIIGSPFLYFFAIPNPLSFYIFAILFIARALTNLLFLVKRLVVANLKIIALLSV